MDPLLLVGLVAVGAVVALALVAARTRHQRWHRRARVLAELAGERVTLDVVIEPHGRQVEVPLDCYLDEVRGEGADALLLLTAPAAADRVPGLGRVPRELAITRVTGVQARGRRLRW